MDLETNVEIGDFRIEKRLGAGGMGVVYQARQKSLDRVVALKVLGAALAHPGDILRFKREAQAAAKLKHPGIATIYYVGQDEQACYMAMDYIDGITLRQLIDRLGTTNNPHLGIATVLHESAVDSKPLRIRFDDLTVEESDAVRDLQQVRRALDAITPEAEQVIASKAYIRRVCEMVRDAALALQHAHENGVVHRDIKPQNIMLDRHGQIHVIDFGIARFFDGNSLTQTGALVGTPMYMSPEQVAGRTNVDHRSDIYSLGLVMYELLTLRRPIYAPTREAVLRGVVTKAMIPVSWKNKGVPRSVESVVHKAISKDPDDRYQTAADFADDLQRCLASEPVVADPYRYKFDEREIVAERPNEITATSFWFYFLAFYFAFYWLPLELSIVHDTKSFHGVSGGMAYVIPIFVLLGIAAGCSWLGRSLLNGKNWAVWLGIPTAVFAIGFHGFYVLRFILGAIFRGKLWESLVGMSSGLVPRFILILGGLTVIFVLLFRHKPREWFRFCQRMRIEHEGLLTSVKSESS